MFDGLIDTVLADVLAWELIATRHTGLQRHSEVHEVDVLFSVVAHVLNKPVEVVTLGHGDTAVLIIIYGRSEG